MEEMRELMGKCIKTMGIKNVYTVLISQMLDIEISKEIKRRR